MSCYYIKVITHTVFFQEGEAGEKREEGEETEGEGREEKGEREREGQRGGVGLIY